MHYCFSLEEKSYVSCCNCQVVGGFKDLFIAPTFDELDQVARDAKGNPQKLSLKQLRSIRENGLVAVMPVYFTRSHF